MVQASEVQKLRQKTGISMMECKKALEEAGGDFEEAFKILRQKGEKVAVKKSEREAGQGVVEAYIHGNGRVGVLLRLSSETDFVAKNEEFKKLAHDIAMHIAAMNPHYISPEDIPREVKEAERQIYQEQNKDKPEEIRQKIIEGKLQKFAEENSLLNQPFIKNEDKTVGEVIKEAISKLGENIKVGDFARFEI